MKAYADRSKQYDGPYCCIGSEDETWSNEHRFDTLLLLNDYKAFITRHVEEVVDLVIGLDQVHTQ